MSNGLSEDVADKQKASKAELLKDAQRVLEGITARKALRRENGKSLKDESAARVRQDIVKEMAE
jgi:hypothetical protein